MYTTQKKTGKLINLWIFSWVIMGLFAIRLVYNLLPGVSNFQSLGAVVELVVMLGFGVYMSVSSNKGIKKTKGIEFDVTATDFVYKTPEVTRNFNSTNPAKSIGKSLTHLTIQTHDGEEITINLDDFSLDYNDLQKIGDAVNKLNALFRGCSENQK